MVWFSRLRSIAESMRYKFGPKFADWIISRALSEARSKILEQGGVSVLIDNTVLGHATIFKTGWVHTGTKSWGGQNFESGHAARMVTHAPDQSELYKNVCFLPGISKLAKEGTIKLFSSAELRDEVYRQPSGRFIGYGFYDFNLFSDISIPSINGHAISATSSLAIGKNDIAKNEQRDRLTSLRDPDFQILLKLMGGKNSQDAFHLLTAERHRLFCFLTMDFKFRRTWESARKNKLYPLRTPVMTPEEFASHFSLKPVPPHILAYDKASFPVRTDFLAPGKPGT